MKLDYLKIPVELCQFALTERKVRQVSIYLAGLFLWPGKVHVDREPIQKLSTLCGVSQPTIYRSFGWLLSRKWMGKDSKNGWYFFRGLSRVHKMEGWKYRRAALMFKKDLPESKAFFIGAVLTSAVKTGNTGAQTDRTSRRSKQLRYPVPLYFLEKVLNVSHKTAYRYRKLAEKSGFIKMEPNLPQVEGLSVRDVRLLKQNNIEHVRVKLFGSTNSVEIHPDQLRTNKGFVFVQLSNWIYPEMILKKRKVS